MHGEPATYLAQFTGMDKSGFFYLHIKFIGHFNTRSLLDGIGLFDSVKVNAATVHIVLNKKSIGTLRVSVTLKPGVPLRRLL